MTKKILILGADGMLGYQAVQYFSTNYDVIGVVRKGADQLQRVTALQAVKCHYEIDVRDFPKLEAILKREEPDVILNCIGIVKQREQASEAVESIELNSLFPHRLAATALAIGSRIFHYSTDCVFSGKKGNYRETDVPDAYDLYGRSKLLGELTYPHCFTFRTSIIGLELFHKKSLIEWYLAQSGEIRGFDRAIYTGFTTLEMCRITELVMKNEGLKGLYQVASRPISKYELLKLVHKELGATASIAKDSDFSCDRSLDGSRFNQEAGYQPPEWTTMIAELADQIRGLR